VLHLCALTAFVTSKTRGNKARISMKTKEEDKKSGVGADIDFECLRCAEGAGRSGWAWWPWLSLRDIADPRHQGSAPSVDRKLSDQSENVYENKG